MITTINQPASPQNQHQGLALDLATIEGPRKNAWGAGVADDVYPCTPAVLVEAP